MGGDAILSHAIHIPGADLHLKGDGLAADDGGMQALVAVWFWRRDVIFKAVRQRVVHVVDEAQRVITLGHILEDDAHGVNIVDLLEILILHVHLAVDAVDALDAVADGGFLDAVFRQMLGNGVADRVQELVAVLVQQVADGLVAHGVQVVQAAVLQLLLDIADAQAVGNGGVDLHRFQGLIAALLLRPGVAGAHIMQPVAQFNDHHADVLTHGQQHLAQVFGLAVLDIGEFDLGQFGDAVHQQGHIGAKFLLDFGHRDGGILGHIVHQGGGDALAVHTQFHQNGRHRQRMADIRLTAAAALTAVGFLGQCVGTVDHVKIIGATAVHQRLL